MEYTINKLAKLAGITTRTLRYYDEIGLISPTRISSNGYRIYGQKEVILLQQILFYRELDVPLDEIKRILLKKEFDGISALESHREALINKRNNLNILIENVEKTIDSEKGKITMDDKERFKGFLDELVLENEKKYGDEIREKYGDEAIDASNEKIKGMSKERYEEIDTLSKELNTSLKAAFEQGDPLSELAQKTCELHRKWLSCFWSSYSKDAHLGITQMYVDDPRFTEYYDKIAPGCAVFLRDAVAIYCK